METRALLTLGLVLWGCEPPLEQTSRCSVEATLSSATLNGVTRVNATGVVNCAEPADLTMVL